MCIVHLSVHLHALALYIFVHLHCTSLYTCIVHLCTLALYIFVHLHWTSLYTCIGHLCTLALDIFVHLHCGFNCNIGYNTMSALASPFSAILTVGVVVDVLVENTISILSGCPQTMFLSPLPPQ